MSQRAGIGATSNAKEALSGRNIGLSGHVFLLPQEAERKESRLMNGFMQVKFVNGQYSSA